MAEAVMETLYEFRSEDTPERWTLEFTRSCRRSPGTGQVTLDRTSDLRKRVLSYRAE